MKSYGAFAAEGHHEPVRVMALHSLVYCERLYYLEEVEEIRLADAAVYAGRRLHDAWSEGEEWESWQLSSSSLNLTGKLDAVKRADGQRLVYERKKGRPDCRGEHPRAWPSDVMQVTAYSMLLEQHLGVELNEARIRYHATKQTVRVGIDEVARSAVRNATARAVELRAFKRRPPVTENAKLCAKCSLAPVCLPEEERGKTKTPRLFPEDLERQTLYVLDHDVKIGRDGYRLNIGSTGKEKKSYPATQVGSIVVHGYAQLTTQALHLCAKNDITVHWLSPGGRFVGSLATGSGGVQRRIRQFDALRDDALCLSLAQNLVIAKVDNTRRFLLRATRRYEREPFELALKQLKKLLREIPLVDSLDSLRGYEGMAAKHFFSVLPRLVHEQAGEEMVPVGRSRRPPKDRFNAALSFGYSLLYRSLLETVLRVGLEPSFGFYHQPRSSAHPLVLDLMELFRLPVIEIAVLASVNRKGFCPIRDFNVTRGGIWLNEEGQRKMIGLYERRVRECYKHPVLKYSLSFRRAFELECRLLEKEWTSAPGLFGKLRIR